MFFQNEGQRKKLRPEDMEKNRLKKCDDSFEKGRRTLLTLNNFKSYNFKTNVYTCVFITYLFFDVLAYLTYKCLCCNMQ